MVLKEMSKSIERQIKEQASQEYMESSMAINIKTQSFPLYRFLPLPLKMLILRVANHVFGENSSCISLSNLGEISFPEDMCAYIKSIDFILTPRIQSPYNCGVVSCNGIMSISFSRSCSESELRNIFFDKLNKAIQF